MLRKIVSLGRHAAFLAHGLVTEPRVSEAAHLDAETLKVLVDALSGAHEYLEYGAGGSTFLALKMMPGRVVTVESDRQFLEAVRKGVPATDIDRFVPVRAEIGITGRWGRPLLALGRDWRVYPRAPWERLPGMCPDVILIDGRFRMACALESMLRLPVDWHGQIIMDDYSGRPHLAAIERFSGRFRRHGRSVSFTRGAATSEELAEALAGYYSDHR